MEDYVKRIFAATAFDRCEGLWWRFRNGGGAASGEDDVLDFYMDCSDLFWWGCSDCELITADNIELLEQSVKDCPDYAGSLFCSRSRKERPQGAWFAKGSFDADVMPLFAACGPEKEVGMGNPYPFLSKEDYQKTQVKDD